MGTGGNSNVGHSSNPTNMYSPVAYGGGNIISGNVGTGGVQIDGSSSAGGGSFDFKLDMPMPIPAMQLQNLRGESWESFDDFMREYSADLAEQEKIQELQNLGFKKLKKIGKKVGKAAKVYNQVAPYVAVIALQ